MPRWMTIQAAARHLGTTAATLSRWAKIGKIPPNAFRNNKIDIEILEPYFAKTSTSEAPDLHAMSGTFAGLEAGPEPLSAVPASAPALELDDSDAAGGSGRASRNGSNGSAASHDPADRAPVDLDEARARRMAALARLAELEVERRRAAFVPVRQIRLVCERIRSELVDEYQIWANWLPTYLQSSGIPQSLALKIQRHALETLMRQFAQRLQAIANDYDD